MIERNALDEELRVLALRYAPKQIAKCGDVVTAQWGGWKQPHKVKITRISVELTSIDCTIAERAKLELTGWMTVQYQYIGRRVKANGELVGRDGVAFLISHFTTDNGQIYNRLMAGFNHVGLAFDVESLDWQDYREGVRGNE